MSVRSDNFFIKQGYVFNQAAKTLDTGPADQYWTSERIEYAARYQHHVYLLAARIATRRHYRVGMDLGCGPGTKAARILQESLAEIILVDQPSSAALAESSLPGARFIGTNLERCEVVLEEPVDLIVCADVVEHLFDPMPCIRFARDSLKASGLAVFSTPERDILRGADCMMSPHSAHVREWNTGEFRALLEHSGFRIVGHLTLPGQRLSPLEEVARLSLGRMLGLARWHSCQVAVCARTP